MNTAEAYAECERITRGQARNFSYGIRLLPAPKRKALSAVYAFARRIDDIGDGDLPSEQKLEALENARKQLHDLGGSGDDPVLTGLWHAAWRFELPLGAFDELIEGCTADVVGTSYETFDELRHYCRCVAGSIGRLSLAVFGSPDRARDERIADDLGIALQLTNILRDVLEDRVAGRIYLPAEDLRAFGCTLDLTERAELADPEDALLPLLEYQAARAEEWYECGLRLLPLLDSRSRACCAAMAGIYHRLLRRMALRPRFVLRGRTSLPDWEKIAVAGRALAGTSP
ncbi:squalene synthase HpnD [Prauserella marina]|uniref:Phytoene synthase n=1 Tax=Prauserella marina TaxID=530584 RepID=A0A222VQD8_9PSEU|nr:squalene/phytoene synthase family protein [Prauserella marina]ASR35941.1 squalene synthase HpnD [Prauserella marina]PWV84130.1 farnesyl-diphosphate farnesyltransferase [Prauserella marina]SDC29673.1 phytoene synthase [Prauserella marina]